jgi:putative SOS response-associated peptidase YedK
MCGRYRIKDPELFRQYVREVYGIELPPLSPRFNIAPSQSLPIVSSDDDGRPRASLMRWGFVPFWDKSEKPKLAPINARSEGAFAKPMFRQSIQKRRCLVPADGFYEWLKLPAEDRKQPYDITLRSGRPFFFAGIYEPATDNRPATYLLFTTRPNELMQPIHDRMPAILTEEQAKQWIQPGPIAAEQLEHFMQPFPAGEMVARPISTLINSPRNDTPECIAGPDDPLQPGES